MEEDWDLQAVVRGCCTSSSSSNSNINNSSSFFSTITNTISTTTATTSLLSTDYPWFPPLDLPEQDQLFSFPDLFAPRTPLEDLEQLCRPFLPPPAPVPAPAPATSPVSLSIPSSSTSILPLQQNHHQQVKTEQKPEQLPHRSFTSPTRTATPSPTPRPKRRKNQQKRVVCQVPAEGLSSDMWAWRKYGQKPIKGSPYPRGYYRCSSSKGCLARKQVERSRTDPTMFIITYTAEHNHPLPTHRNSLAGSTRHKGSSSNTVNKPSCSSSSPPTTTTSGGGLSPTTPLSIEEELLQQKSRGGEDEEEVDMEMEMEMEGEEGDDELLIPEGLLSDDLFMELEELTKPGSGTEPGHRPITGPTNSDQFPASFPWITAAGGS